MGQNRVTDIIEFFIHGRQVTTNGIVYDFIEEQRVDIESLQKELATYIAYEKAGREKAISLDAQLAAITSERDEAIRRLQVNRDNFDRAEAQNKKLMDALEFYADERNYQPYRKHKDELGSEWVSLVEDNNGLIAQQALQSDTSDLHNWECIDDTPSLYDSAYKCSKCGVQTTESMDGPCLPKDGCKPLIVDTSDMVLTPPTGKTTEDLINMDREDEGDAIDVGPNEYTTIIPKDMVLVPREHKPLMEFYMVTTYEELVDMQAAHIVRLQKELPQPPDTGEE